MSNPIHNTIEYLHNCQALRAAGARVCFVHDPAWLVNVAINRRAGWPDDPSCTRGSCKPALRKGAFSYPPKASGDTYNHLRLLAGKINSPRLIVHIGELGEWRPLLLTRIPHRFDEDEVFQWQATINTFRNYSKAMRHQILKERNA